MPKIEITTTQKVIIQYDTAGFIPRAMAFFIDKFVISVVFSIITLVIFPDLSDVLDDENPSNWVVLIDIFLLLIFLFYPLALEIFSNGQSIGKKLMNISVVKLSGEPLEINDYWMRFAYRFIDFALTFFTLGSLTILFSKKNQRIGDMVANTTVIKLKPDRNITLLDLKELQINENFEPKYPLVVKYTDEEMLLIKNLISRKQEYRNIEIYNNMVDDVVEKIKSQLNIDTIPEDKIIFLKDLINEYVILTR